MTLKIDFKKSRGKNKLVDDIQHSLNYKMSTIVKKIFSHLINTLKHTHFVILKNNIFFQITVPLHNKVGDSISRKTCLQLLFSPHS